MRFNTSPGWASIPAGWVGGRGGALAERSGTQLTTPSGALVQDTANIGPDGALQISTVWACVNLRANVIASLPYFAFETHNGQRQLARTSRLYSLLHESPNARMTPFEFWRAMVLNLDLRGRAYARLDRDERTGEVISMWPMPADQVESVVLKDGTMVYVYTIDGNVAVFSESNVLHLKGLGNGTEGLSKLEYMRASTHEAAAAQTAATKMFGNGGKPTGLLMVDNVLKPEQRAAIRERFAEMALGNASRLFVLEADMKYQQLSLSPEDLQLLETRRFSVEEICRWFDMPPVLVHHANVTAWGSGIEQVVEGFFKLSLRPTVVNIEQAVRKRVQTSAQRARQTAEFGLDALLRASPAVRMELYAKAVQNGLKTRNEIRQLENDPPLPGGDDLTVQSALLPIHLLGKVKRTGGKDAAPEDPVAQ
ncbi:MAG: phage portal protein [Rubrivivax sp.]|nr:MAG: phage portal protein [Rubrivivax sp.]